jgi:hypothetical protein
MPHYFFDLTDEKIIHDFKGKQLRDHKQAREHALVIALDLVRTKSTLLREPVSACCGTSSAALSTVTFSPEYALVAYEHR